jgi:hypothetical protein
MCLDHGFANCGTQNTTGKAIIVYCCAALVTNRNAKRTKMLNKDIKHKPHTVMATLHNSSPLSARLSNYIFSKFKCLKVITGTMKLLNLN